MKKLLLVLLSLNFASAFAHTCFELEIAPTNLTVIPTPKVVCLENLSLNNNNFNASLSLDGALQEISVDIEEVLPQGTSQFRASTTIHIANYNSMQCSTAEAVSLSLEMTLESSGKILSLNKLTGVSSYTSDNCHVEASTENFDYIKMAK